MKRGIAIPFLLPFILVACLGLSQESFAQVVETQGENYDLVENFNIGEASWVSHPDRIMDGSWKNYVLTDTNEKVIFNSNAVGSLIFDKNSCSYSIYGNGFDGEQIIPSVSAVATYLNNGQWQNLPINDESCIVEVSEYEDGVYLTSTKVITEDVTEDVFIDYTGTTENFYVNATNANFDLVQSSNGTNIGYYNGETITTTGIEVEKFVQELRLDINSGFKETFKVWHDGDESLGISQTVHVGESITIGETVIPITQYSGQSFSKQYLEDNKAQVFAITDQLNYDFDIGFQSLSNVNIIFDETSIIPYKVNLDYANGNFVNYLEIDPTFTSGAGNVRAPYSNIYDCMNNGGGSTTQNYIGADNYCYKGGAYWDITTIPDSSVITGVTISYTHTNVINQGSMSCDWYSIEGQLSTDTWADVWTDVSDGTSLHTNTCRVTDSTMVMGSDAIADLQAELAIDNEFGIGIDPNQSTHLPAGSYNIQLNLSNIILEATYVLPTTPQPPTGLTTVAGIPIETSWTAPTDNGGSAITGYKVFRTLNEFAQTELPDSSGSDGQITFTDNELLIHGFPISDSSTNSISVTLPVGSTQTTPVAWQNAAGGISINGNTITKSGNSWGNGVQGTTTFTSSEGAELVFNVGSNTQHSFVGFGKDPFVASSSDIQYVMYPASNGTICFYENNVQLSSLCNNFTYTSSDNLKVKMDSNGVVTYWKNTTLLYTSTLQASGTYYVQAALYSSGVSVSADLVSYPPPNTTASTTGVIGQAIQSPDLSFTNANLPSGTSPFSVGGWVKLDSSSPTDTKLLGINDVTFNVGTTTASAIGISPTLTSTTSTFTDYALWGTARTTSYDYNIYTAWSNDFYQYIGGGGNYFTAAEFDISAIPSSATVTSATFSGESVQYGSGGGTNCRMTQLPNSVTSYASTNDVAGLYNAITGGASLGSSGFCSVGVFTDSFNSLGVQEIQDAVTNGENVYWGFTGSSIYGRYGADNQPVLSITYTHYPSSLLVSATGLADNTSTAQHYTFTRDSSNLWSIYQNGVSQATNTDSTSLGSNVGNNYSTKLSGSLDEFFINSDVLTATEIDNIYDRGAVLTPLTTVTATEYDDNTVVATNTYYYSVQSVNAIGSSDYLTPFVSALAGVPPDPPTITGTSIASPNVAPLDIIIDWSSPLNTGTAGITNYEIYRDATLITTVGNVNTYTDTVPTGGGTFVYSLKSITSHGTSTLSGTASQTTATPPPAPTSAPTLDIANPNPSPLDVTVSFALPSSGGSAITSFEIFRSTDDITYTSVGTTSNLIFYDTVPNAGLYHYKFASTNLVGTGSQSPSSNITTANEPDAITDLATSAITDTTATLTWTAPNSNGSDIVDYTLYRDGVLISTSATTGFSDTGLITQTSYDYTVYARNNVGLSLISNSVTQVTDGVAGVVPLTATTAAMDQINLTWTEPNNYNSAITNYIIERESPTGGGFTTLITLGSVLSYSDGSLTAVTEYNYRITAVNGYGNGATSTSSAITLPAPPTNLTVNDCYHTCTTQLNLEWVAPVLSTGVNGYKITFETPVGGGFSTLVANTTTTTLYYNHTGLVSGQFYNYKVQTLTAVGESQVSNAYSYSPHKLPDSVDDLVVTTNSLLQFILNWSVPDNLYGTLSGYMINYTTPAGDPTTIYISDSGSPSTTSTISGFDPTVEHSFRVSAVTTHGTNATLGNISNGTITSEILIGSLTIDSSAVNPDVVPIWYVLSNVDANTDEVDVYFKPSSGAVDCTLTERNTGVETNYTSIAETVDGSNVFHTFTVTNAGNGVAIDFDCWDSTDLSINEQYALTQADASSAFGGFGNVPMFSLMANYTSGLYGTDGEFAGIDLITLFIVIVSMLFFNRTNPALGVGGMAMMLGVAWYFEVIPWTSGVLGGIAVVLVLALGQGLKNR